MGHPEELKKFKELLDQGAISEDEFNRKKQEILSIGTYDAPTDEGSQPQKSKAKMNKNKKIIFGVLAGVLLLVALFIGITKLSAALDKKAKCDAASDAIASLMSEYGLTDYKVISASSLGTNVLCAEFENLSNTQKYNLIKATLRLSDITVKGDKIGLDCDFYVNSRDYYYYISPLWAKDSRNSYTSGGIYKYDGNRYCVYPEY